MAFCTQCGKELQDGLRFCTECGTAVVDESRPAYQPSIATAVKDVAEAAEAVIPEIPIAGGVVEVLAPAEVGKVTLSTWKSAPPAAQAVGATVGQAQKAAKAAKNSPVAKKSKLPVALVAVGAAILVAAFSLYVVPLFIPHPYDPNSHVALTSDSSSIASGSSTSSTSSSEGSSGSSSSSSNGSASSSSSSESSSSSTSGSTSSATGSYSTDERPKIDEFKWLDGEAMKGNVPVDAKQIVDFDALTGGWKCYIVGNMEWLANADIEAGQAGAIIAIDWYYLRVTSDDVREDTTPTSSFTGSFDGGMLDATGSGRVTIAAFWEKDGHQYATGSFIWPSGETSTIALVRP